MLQKKIPKNKEKCSNPISIAISISYDHKKMR